MCPTCGAQLPANGAACAVCGHLPEDRDDPLKGPARGKVIPFRHRASTLKRDRERGREHPGHDHRGSGRGGRPQPSRARRAFRLYWIIFIAAALIWPWIPLPHL
jgi:hypothetical protein